MRHRPQSLMLFVNEELDVDESVADDCHDDEEVKGGVILHFDINQRLVHLPQTEVE